MYSLDNRARERNGMHDGRLSDIIVGAQDEMQMDNGFMEGFFSW